jgi:polyphosphate kinase
VRSILGRFLEHSRLYCFEAGDERTYLIGSADLMQRNLDHRIEVVVPIEAPHVRAEIETIFRRLLSDNSQAWLMSPDGSWERATPVDGERRRASQLVAMRGRMRARRRSAPGT